MSFRFRCPKCGSSHVTIDADRHSTYGDNAHHYIKCTICAWMLYGDENIRREVDRQQAVTERRQLESYRLRTEQPERADEGEDRGATCAWEGCTNPQRPNSKYCSRECSNKNARARYKSRMENKKAGAGGSEAA